MYKVLALPCLLGLSAFFSGTEAALFSLQPLEVERIKRKEGGMAVKALNRLLANKEAFLTTVLIGNEVVNVAVSSLAASLALTLWGDKGLGISVAVMTFLLVLYGEMAPKAWAVAKAPTWALWASVPILVFSYLIFPVRWLLARLAGGVSRVLPLEEKGLGEREFKALVREGRRKGVIKDAEQEMILKVFRFSHTRVGEVMTPRTEMFVLDVNTPPREAYEKLKEVTYREVPLYEGNLDSIVGIMRTKDLLGLPWGIVKVESLREVMTEPYFVPESKEVAELLREFQKKRLHMAIVIDEYGGVAGLITLEDVIEELVGEISDEFDREGEELEEIAPGLYRVYPRMALETLEERLGIPYPEEDVDIDTVGGLVFHLFGRVPQRGEAVEYQGWRFIVEDIKRTRILRLRLERVDGTQETQETLH